MRVCSPETFWRHGRTDLVLVVFLLGAAVILYFLSIPRLNTAPEASSRAQSRNNLKQIGLALYNYHDVHNTLPPSSIVRMPPDDRLVTADDDSSILPAREPEGTPLHGWMTSVLPFLYEEKLFLQVDFHQPWTSPENQNVFGTRVSGYLHPGLLRADSSSERVNELAAAHYAANSQLMRPNGKRRFRDVPDGLSSTILAGEVTFAIHPWGSPNNVRDPAEGLGPSAIRFCGPDPKVTQFLMADGSVRAISSDIDLETLQHLADPEDGQQIADF